MIVYTPQKEKIELAQRPFSSGGEGAVYAVCSAPGRFRDICVKIYSPNKRDNLREAKIKFMVANPPEKIRGNGFLIGWPLDYVTDNKGKFIGFIMPLAFHDSKQLVELTSYSISKRLGKEWHDRYDVSVGKKSLISRLKLLYNIASPIHILHSTNKYVLKDFKPQNVLVTYDGHVTIVDMDSIQITDGSRLLFPGTAVTPEYMPPEFFTNGVGKSLSMPVGKSWDYFAFGVVFYEILFGIHPYCVTPKKLKDNSENSRSTNISLGLFPFGANKHMIEVCPRPHDRFAKLPQEFQNKFIRTFSGNPNNRPSAFEWGEYVYQLVKEKRKDTPPITKTWEMVGSHCYGLARVKDQNGLYGFIDWKSNLVIPCKWNYAGDFICKRARVRDEKGLYGYIDLSGNLVISCRFGSADDFFNNGIAKVKNVLGEEICIDIDGHKIGDNNNGDDKSGEGNGTDDKGEEKSGCLEWFYALLGVPIICSIIGGIIGIFVHSNDSIEIGLLLGAIIGFIFVGLSFIESALE